MAQKNYRVAILTKTHTARLRDVGDINARGLLDNMPKGYEADLVYLERSTSKKAKNTVSFWHALFRKYDAIYASSPKRYYAILCLVFAFSKAKPLYLSVFDSSIAPITTNKLGKILFLFLVKKKLLIPFSVSKYQQQFFGKKLGIKPPILYPCLTTYGERTKPKRKKPPIVLFAGSTNNEKRGLDTLLKAISLLVTEFPDLEVRILNKFSDNQRTGMSESKFADKLKIKKHITLVGFVPSMAREYEKTWVYVLPFKRTKFIPPIPFTIIEALSFGVPTVSTKLPHLAELLPKGSLVPTADPEGLAKAIRKGLKNRKPVALPPDFKPKRVAKEFGRLIFHQA